MTYSGCAYSDLQTHTHTHTQRDGGQSVAVESMHTLGLLYRLYGLSLATPTETCSLDGPIIDRPVSRVKSAFHDADTDTPTSLCPTRARFPEVIPVAS